MESSLGPVQEVQVIRHCDICAINKKDYSKKEVTYCAPCKKYKCGPCRTSKLKTIKAFVKHHLGKT